MLRGPGGGHCEEIADPSNGWSSALVSAKVGPDEVLDVVSGLVDVGAPLEVNSVLLGNQVGLNILAEVLHISGRGRAFGWDKVLEARVAG